MPRSGFTPYFPVWTRPGNAAGDRRFFPATGPLRSSGIKSVLVALEMYASQGDVLIEPACQDSDDAQVWPNWATFKSIGGTPINLSADGFIADTAWQAVTINRPFVRLGFAVRNTSTAAIQHALAALRFEVRSC